MRSDAWPFVAGGRAPLPTPPTRDQICTVRCELQGIQLSNGWHLFEPEIGWLGFDAAFRSEAYAKKRLPRPGAPAGDTHVALSLDPPQSLEPGLASLPRIKQRIRDAITEEGMSGVLLFCMGDGNPAGERDHDPGAFGWQWLMDHFAEIHAYMQQGEDLTPWIVYVPGFDGVVPAWQPFTRVNDYVSMARSVVGPTGHLGIELANGYMSWTGEANCWSTEDGKKFDVILQEFPIGVSPCVGPPPSMLTPDGAWGPWTTNDQRAPWTQTYQIVGRMVRPYTRPAWVPTGDDPNPPFVLAGGTPRGPFFYVGWEIDTYLWCRVQRISRDEIDAHRQCLITMGCTLVG